MHNLLGRLAPSTFTFRRYSLDYCLYKIKEMGFNSIELFAYHPHYSVYEAEALDAKPIAEKILSAGLKVPVIEPEQNFYPINIVSSNRYLREKSLEQIKYYIKNAPLFSCDRITLLPGKNLMDDDNNKSIQTLVSSLKELCSYAEDYGVILQLENVSKAVSGMTPSRAAVEHILSEVNRSNLKLAVNTSAVYSYGEDIQDWFDLFGDRIGTVELSDADSKDEQFELGTGEIDIGHILKVIEDARFSGPVSLHLTMEEYAENPVEPYLGSLNYLKSMEGSK